MKKFILDSLHSCALFQGLEEQALKKIAEEYAVFSSCEKNSVIFSETQYTRSLVILLRGSVSVVKNGGSGKLLMNILKSGDIFGMAAMFYEEETFLTQITALEKVDLLTVSKENLVQIFSLYPLVSQNYITILSEKIHFLNQKISTYTKPETVQKVASFLLQHMDTNGKTAVLPYSITSIADTLNTGRASVYRAFDSLERDGVISRSGKTITVHNLTALKNL